MREIIFRGKLKVDNGEHKKGDWVFGDLVRIKDGEKTSTMIYGFGEVDPSTVAQYTGLTDQNGTKIFEWDIIQHDFGSDQIGVQYAVVEYDSKYASFMINPLYDWMFCEKNDCEVIGNIHDNPELMKGADQ